MSIELETGAPVEAPAEEVVVGAPETAPQISDIEQRALDMGWKPKEQFTGIEDDFIDAKEFVRRKPLFDKIESQNRQVKLLNRSINELKEHFTKVNAATYDRALADLKAQRKDAIVNGDGEAFSQIDDKIKEAEAQRAELEALNQPVPEQQADMPQFASWKARNPWYNNVKYMRSFADELGTDLHQRGMAPDQVLTEVEKAVRLEFPEKFRNPNKASAIPVENGRPSGKSKDTFEMSDFERKVMNDFVRSKTMTKEEYIAGLKLTRGT
jgi:hypothetical protein